MDFLEIKINCPAEFNDILIAEISTMGFDSFVENENGFYAYLEAGEADQDLLNAIREKYLPVFSFSYELNAVEKKNWNQQWESNYEPIFIGDECVVRASFHQFEKSYPYEIVINPKMSFGTGHHETTYLMLKNQLVIDHQNKSVLDVGCGTGVLAIMAKLRGARLITACDIDEWSIENCLENIELNQCGQIRVQKGDVTTVSGKYDIIVGNINRNVLIHDLPHYAKKIESSGGKLLLSGFYRHDEDMLIRLATELGFTLSVTSCKNDWSCLLFEK